MEHRIGHADESAQYHTPPRQERSQKTLEKIYKATRKIVSCDGFEHATIAKIVKEAGVSSGAFYKRFSSKDELYDFVHSEYTNRATTHVLGYTEPDDYVGLSLAQTLEQLLIRVGSVSKTEIAFRGAVLRRALIDKSFAVRFEKFRRIGVERYKALLEPHAGCIQHEDPIAAIEFVVFELLSTNTMRYDLPGMTAMATSMDAQGLTTEILRSKLRYLGIE